MKQLYTFVLAAALALTLAGCNNDGPAENAGEKIDNSMDKMGNQIEDACEEAKEGAKMDDQDC